MNRTIYPRPSLGEGEGEGLLTRLRRGERGSLLVQTLLLVVAGVVIVGAFLSFMRTGVSLGRVREVQAEELYAADAGITDARWQIDHDGLASFDPPYSPYDFSGVRSYALEEQPNGQPVTVSLRNVWIPSNVAAPELAAAEALVEAGKLVVAGEIEAPGLYSIRLTYYPQPGEELTVPSIGLWLPAGFDYVVGSSELEASPSAPYYAVPAVTAHAGGQAILWSFNNLPFSSLLGVLPGADPKEAEFTLSFSTALERNPQAVAWITTAGVAEIPFAWDADTHVFQINSVAGRTEIEAHASASIPRQLGAAIGGDYKAIGATLMRDLIPDGGGPRRDTLLAENSASAVDIPDSATAKGAYLYWSAWLASAPSATPFTDSASNFNNWTKSGSDWVINSNAFRGHHAGAEVDRTLTLTNALDLSSYANALTRLKFDYWESGTLESDDGLELQLSSNGGATWSAGIPIFLDDVGSSAQPFALTLPNEYMTASFKMRFQLLSLSGSSEYAFVDNVRIVSVALTAADNAVTFKINGTQVYFDAEGLPAEGLQELTADTCQMVEDKESTYSYACSKDVTELVRAYSDLGSAGNHTGNGSYTLGGVTGSLNDEWSFAGWSLVLIYASPETRGHQLYLFDKFRYSDHFTNIDFDDDGVPGGSLSGFLVPVPIAGEVNAAQITVFIGEGDNYYPGDQFIFNGSARSDGLTSTNVWNGWSATLIQDGIDLDTFAIPWDSGLLQPGDTSAHIDLPTNIDIWNLIYIIVSFRSEITSGGTIDYLIIRS